jgi:hypothetical protein
MKGVKAELMAYSKEPFIGYLVMLSVFCIFFYFFTFGRLVQNYFQKWYGKMESHHKSTKS